MQSCDCLHYKTPEGMTSLARLGERPFSKLVKQFSEPAARTSFLGLNKFSEIPPPMSVLTDEDNTQGRLFVVLSKQRKEWFGHIFNFWDRKQLYLLDEFLNKRRVVFEIAFSKVFHGGFNSQGRTVCPRTQ